MLKGEEVADEDITKQTRQDTMVHEDRKKQMNWVDGTNCTLCFLVDLLEHKEKRKIKNEIKKIQVEKNS